MTLSPMARPPQTRRFSPLQDVWFPSALLRENVLANYLEFAEILRRKGYGPEEWKQYRTKRLREVLARVVSDSPFYQARLASCDVRNITLENLARLPFMSRSELQQHGKAAYARPFSSGGICYPTHHNGRGPVSAPSSWFELLASSLATATNLADCIERHVAPHEPVAAVLAQSDCDSLADTYCDALRNLGIAHLRGWSASAAGGMQKWREMLADIGANILVASPATLMSLWPSERATDRGPLVSAQAKLVLVAGGTANRAFLHQLSTAYGGVPCLPFAFGSAESLAVASTCGMGNLHVAMQNYVTEVVDLRTGEAVVPGTPGELVLTSLLSGIRPLVRYRTDSVVALRPSTCACGSKADVLIDYGSVSDMLYLNGRRWFAKELEEGFVRNTRHMHDFRMSVGKHDNRDALHIEIDRPIVGDPRFAEAALGLHFGATVRILQIGNMTQELA
jgi:phenylacetate-CoA ligase